MTFLEWRKRFYPDVTDKDVLTKMSHAWAAGMLHMAIESKKVPDWLVKRKGAKIYCSECLRLKSDDTECL